MSDDTTTDAVEAALRRVEDPEAGVNVFEAGLVEDVTVHDGRATVALDLGEFDAASAEAVAGAVVRAARSVEGVEGAYVQRAAPTADDDDRDAGVGAFDRVVAVASTKGGVGKSTVAANLACELAAGGDDVALFDADIYGPNAPALLDATGPVRSTEEGRPRPVDAGDLEVMSVGLMADESPLAWRGAMAHDALTELFEDTAWSHDDVLVVDLPPGTGDTVLTTLQEVPVDGVVLVTTPFHTSVADIERSVDLFRENEVPVLGAVVNMRSFTCPSCGDDHDLFAADGLDALDVPVVAELPFARAFQTSPRADRPPAVADLATAVRERLAAAWRVDAPDDAVDLRGLDGEERHERVRDRFETLAPGEPFALVSDRDPSPVRPYLAEIAGVDTDDVEPFDVRRTTPEAWVLRTERP
ncbi:MAG: P-loop NTPase [Haloferacaceae archaeon]